LLGRTPTYAAASRTEPPAATNAARTSTWRAVGVPGSDPRRYPSLMPVRDIDPEEYARWLYADGVAKGWLR
jgi:hypothetical protein